MNRFRQMIDYIRKAVELADGWEYHIDPNGELWLGPNGVHRPHISGSSLWIIDECPQPILDALAAQLVRQVDAFRFYYVETQDDWTAVASTPSVEGGTGAYLATSKGPDRTMNTIKAIVDSKVLE